MTQSGFRRDREYSTETALAQVTDDILEASDRGIYTILALFDFSRAFDCIGLELIVAKLR